MTLNGVHKKWQEIVRRKFYDILNIAQRDVFLCCVIVLRLVEERENNCKRMMWVQLGPAHHIHVIFSMEY